MKRAFIERRLKKQREDIKKIDATIAQLQIDRNARQAVIEELDAILRYLPKHTEADGSRELRPGTDVYRARETLRMAGEPLHIHNLLEAMGVFEPTAEQKRSLSAQMSAYANKSEIFVRPARGTFGLLDYTVPEPTKEEQMMWRREHYQRNEGHAVYDDDDIPF